MSGLELAGVAVARNGTTIIRDATLSVPRGRVTVLLGPNGAGKTTLLEAVSGVLPGARGEVSLGGRPLLTLRRAQRAKLGLGHVEQGRTVFAGLTVQQNLRVAGGPAAAAAALEIFPELSARLQVDAGQLSGGEQQMLVLARAIALKPRILLIDELSLGLAPTIVGRLMPLVRQLADDGVGVLLVEQYARLALEIGDHAYVLTRGGIGYDGPCGPLLEDREILHGAYLAAPTDR